MKILRMFDSLKFVVAAIVCTLILNVAHADTTAIQSVIAYGKTEQTGTPTPTNPVPIMTNNGELTVSRNLSDGLVIGGISMEGALVSMAQRLRTNYIDIEGQRRYTYSTNLDELVDGVHAVIAFYDSNKVTLQRTANNPVDGTVLSPATARYMAVAYYNSAETVSEYQSRVKFRLFQGTSADEIYTNGLTETIRDAAGHKATAQMLLSVGDYKDEQNITTGAITRRVGVKVLDGSEDWGLYNWSAGNVRDVMRVTLSSIAPDAKSGGVALCSHFVIDRLGNFNGNTSAYVWGTTYFDSTPRVAFRVAGITTVAQFKSWLAEQYANGTPVIVLYPLATETTESVATQTMTTAPVRQTLGAIMNMPIKTILTDNTEIMSDAEELIKIATTKYNEESFTDVQDALTGVFNAVDTVVTQTMTQAQAIDTIATNKQTRPDETCPVGKNCLLVEDEQGVPHWYVIAGADEANPSTNP